MAGAARKKRGPSPHCLPKWALFKLLPIRCGVPGPDQARSLQHPMVQPASHARTTKCRGLSENKHKLESDGGLGGIEDICQHQTPLTAVLTKAKKQQENLEFFFTSEHSISQIHTYGVMTAAYMFIITDFVELFSLPN